MHHSYMAALQEIQEGEILTVLQQDIFVYPETGIWPEGSVHTQLLLSCWPRVTCEACTGSRLLGIVYLGLTFEPLQHAPLDKHSCANDTGT